jgi:putative DNA primase/helicase
MGKIAEILTKQFEDKKKLTESIKEKSKTDENYGETDIIYTEPKKYNQTQSLIPNNQLVNVNEVPLSFPDRIAQANFIQAKNPIIYDSDKIYWLWDWAERSYNMVDETDILIKVQHLTGDKNVVKSIVKSEILESIRQTGRQKYIPDVPINFIQFKNCVIDINTSDEFIGNSDYFYTSPIPHNLGTSDSTPYIDKLFVDWVGEENKITLYEILAYSLYQGYPIHRVFTLYGGGRNGKSQYEEIVKNLIGVNNTCSTSIDNLSQSRFESFNLFKKRVAFIAETDFGVMRKTSMFKALSGDDSMRAEIKGKGNISFNNYAKIIIGTNNLPSTDDKTNGFYSRWLIIDFPNQFKDGKPVVLKIPEWEYENLCRKLIPILKNLLDRGSFTMDGLIEDRKNRFEEKSNPLLHFINEKCIIDINKSTKFDDFYEEFEIWRSSRRYQEITKRRMFRELKNEGFTIRRKKIDKIHQQLILGVILKKKSNHLTPFDQTHDWGSPMEQPISDEYL